MLFADNPQDRGLLRTGRHEGDWEVVQYRLRRGRIVQGVYAQHSGAEACGTRGLRIRPSGRPVVFLARGSHAAYFRPGRARPHLARPERRGRRARRRACGRGSCA